MGYKIIEHFVKEVIYNLCKLHLCLQQGLAKQLIVDPLHLGKHSQLPRCSVSPSQRASNSCPDSPTVGRVMCSHTYSLDSKMSSGIADHAEYQFWRGNVSLSLYWCVCMCMRVCVRVSFCIYFMSIITYFLPKKTFGKEFRIQIHVFILQNEVFIFDKCINQSMSKKHK